MCGGLEQDCPVCCMSVRLNTKLSSRRVLDDGEELNLVLLKLVEYLGHPNNLLSGIAFDEVSIVQSIENERLQLMIATTFVQSLAILCNEAFRTLLAYNCYSSHSRSSSQTADYTTDLRPLGHECI